MSSLVQTDRPVVPSSAAPTGSRFISTLARGLALPALLLGGLMLPAAASAQNAAPVAVDPAVLQKLMQRIDELEAQVKSLKNAPAPAPVPAPAPLPVAAAPVPVSVKETFPKVQFNVLGDITYHVSNGKGESHTFALGDVDPIVTAQLSEKGSVLGDFVIASDNAGFAFETERLLLRYSVNDLFNIEAGRFHTAIGYYNNTYHNGTYFQTPVERPAIYHFEDGEGILPVHSNGISVNGDLPSGAWRLHYVAEVANGRDYDPDASHFRIEDDNNFKAFNLALSARPEFLSGTVFGVSAYHDTLTLNGLPRVNQWIYSAYGVYKTSTFEWLNEVILVRHTPHGEKAFNTTAAYTQLSRKFGKLRPYVRLQWRNSPADDPVLERIEQNVSVWGPTVGIRYDFTPMMAIKAEFEHSKHRDEKSLEEGTLQWTFRY